MNLALCCLRKFIMLILKKPAMWTTQFLFASTNRSLIGKIRVERSSLRLGKNSLLHQSVNLFFF